MDYTLILKTFKLESTFTIKDELRKIQQILVTIKLFKLIFLIDKEEAKL
jgi:hypothetical protein